MQVKDTTQSAWGQPPSAIRPSNAPREVFRPEGLHSVGHAREGHGFSRADKAQKDLGALAPEVSPADDLDSESRSYERCHL